MTPTFSKKEKKILKPLKVLGKMVTLTSKYYVEVTIQRDGEKKTITNPLRFFDILSEKYMMQTVLAIVQGLIAETIESLD